jgi:hypothetical protein
MKTGLKALAVAAVIAAAAPMAHAGSVVLTLTRNSLTNVDDAAGRWQHSGGDVFKGGVKVGQFIIHRRVTFGGTSAPLNTAATTITLFMATASGSAPQNITLQGAHDFGPGNFRGGVSGASNRYSWLHGADASYSSAGGNNLSLVMSWTGASQLTVP